MYAAVVTIAFAVLSTSSPLNPRYNPQGLSPNETNGRELLTSPAFVFNAVAGSTNVSMGSLNAYTSPPYMEVIKSGAQATPGFDTWIADGTAATIDFPSNSTTTADATVFLLNLLNGTHIIEPMRTDDPDGTSAVYVNTIEGGYDSGKAQMTFLGFGNGGDRTPATNWLACTDPVADGRKLNGTFVFFKYETVAAPTGCTDVKLYALEV